MDNKKIPSSITLNGLTIRKPFNVDRKMVTFEINDNYQMTLLSIEDLKKLNEYLIEILKEK